MFPPQEFQLLIAPDRLTDDELRLEHTSKRPTIVWREGEFWRVCRWATGHEASEMLSVGWEIFGDWDATKTRQRHGLLTTTDEMKPLDDEDAMPYVERVRTVPMTVKNEEDRVQAFLRELDHLCERHGLWLDTGGLDNLVRVTQQRLGPYFGRRIDEGHPILCSLPFEGGMNTKKGERNRIIIDPAIRGRRPVIRGMRITVGDVIRWLASGMSEAEILENYPELTEADIRAALDFAAGREENGRLLDRLEEVEPLYEENAMPDVDEGRYPARR